MTYKEFLTKVDSVTPKDVSLLVTIFASRTSKGKWSLDIRCSETLGPEERGRTFKEVLTKLDICYDNTEADDEAEIDAIGEVEVPHG